MTLVVPDCSFLSHALIPLQQSESAIDALRAADEAGHELVAPSAVLIEFMSLLRKLVTRRRLTLAEAMSMLDYTSVVITRRVEPSDAVLARAWSFAGQLGQSDVFDSLGYAIAEEIGAEFWTSDLRFSNAAAHARLSSIRYIP